MSLSPDGASLLTNSMDKSLICWDVRAFVNGNRFSKAFIGAQVFTSHFSCLFSSIHMSTSTRGIAY